MVRASPTARSTRATTCRSCWWAAANLLVTLMDKMDVPVDHVGGSTGKLPLDSISLA
jgi:hypothetical protein